MGTNEAKQITIKLGVGLVAAVLLVPINYESKAEPLLTPAILDRVDPKHQLGDGERTIAGLCALMQFHIGRGEPEKAKRAASALLYAFQIHKRRYEMIADAALKRGEISTATRAAAMAYAKMPTSRDLRFELIADGQISATGTDDTTGKIVNRRILSPQRLGAQLIGGLPENFEKLIADIAEEEVPESQPPIPAKPPRVSREERPKFSTGTGFFVTSEGHALTNAHVTDNCQVLSVRTPDAAKIPARIIAQSRTDDLAVLKVMPSGTAFLPLRITPSPRVGEQIVVFGFPMSGLLTSAGNATTGNISALAGIRNRDTWLQVSAPVQPGNSGGPLLDMYGNVVGIVVAKLDALRIASALEDIPQNVNFAIKSVVAKNF